MWSCTLGLCLLFLAPLYAQEEGAYLFKTYCANCHEAGNGEQPRGPERSVLAQMAPQHILDVLEKGAMKAQAAERSRAQRRVLAEYVSGKPLGIASADLIPQSAFCSDKAASFSNPLSGPAWNGWGATLTNTRFQPAEAARLNPDDVRHLKLKWAFGYPGATSGGTQPVVVGGRLYVATAEGDVYSLDAKTGCVYWSFQADAGVRSAISIGKTGGKFSAYFGDQSANVYALTADTGKLLWKKKIDSHPRAAITGAPVLYAGHLYVPVSSREESQVSDPKYPCCQFRGSMVALNASDGKVLWKTYTIPEEAQAIGKNSIGTQLWGPSGAPIWNAPTIDAKRNLLYVGTGNNYSTPSTSASDAVLAFDLKSGKLRWSKQVAENDIWNSTCRRPDRNPLLCPDAEAPDTDFANSPALVDLNGRQIIVVGNKTGMVFAMDPDHQGNIIWQKSTGKGATSGGVMWGSAIDGENVYSANAFFNPSDLDSTGGITAFNLKTGDKVWSVPPPACIERSPCKPSHAAAVTAIPNVIFSGTLDGRLRAISTRDGKVLWEYDTARKYETVNGVQANGGSISNAGPTVVDGMVYTNSGYSHHGGIIPGNVLLAFSVE
jgi:polyvinyl alcohol dehydrogenase (cytochrome)